MSRTTAVKSERLSRFITVTFDCVVIPLLHHRAQQQTVQWLHMSAGVTDTQILEINYPKSSYMYMNMSMSIYISDNYAK